MTTAHLARTARTNLELTADWMLTAMSAVMAQVDEQVRGRHHGTTPGLDNDPALHKWLTRTYGPQDPAQSPDGLSPAAVLTHRLRATQARRIRTTMLMPVDTDVTTACRILAGSRAFRGAAPAPLPGGDNATIVFPAGGTPVAHAATPGADPDRTVDCITIAEGRALELSAAPELNTLPQQLREVGGGLPPLLPDSDLPWAPTPTAVDVSREMVARAAREPHTPTKLTTVDMICALTHAVNAGFFTLTEGTAATSRGLEPIVRVLPPV